MDWPGPWWVHVILIIAVSAITVIVSRVRRDRKARSEVFIISVIELPCRTKSIGRSKEWRDADREIFGHAVHECFEHLNSGTMHDGQHRCACGYEWPDLLLKD